MLIMNPLIDSWRGLQALMSEQAKYSNLNLFKILPNISQSKTAASNPKALGYLPFNKLTKNQSISEVNLDATINSLKTNGFFLGINLSKPIVQEIVDFSLSNPCYGNGNNNLSFSYDQKEQVKTTLPLTFGSYANISLLCPAIKKLESDPILLGIANKYLDAEPVHQGSQLRWNFSGKTSIYERRLEAQKFQYHNHPRCLRFFFYLTDVDLCSSPHVCVRGSHINKPLAHRFLRSGCSQQKIRQYYGYENIVPICGKAGFGFVENPQCFHKGNPPGSKDRLTLLIEFARKKT
jgi:hypothetical protein